VKDTRTRAWWAVPLEGFIGRLVDARKLQKALSKDPSLTEQHREAAKGLDGMLKLMINTLYGVMASRFFTVGNTVVANNITARARVAVWMLAKALRLRQCITDGGIYEHTAVCAFEGRKPGLDTLSRMWEWENRNRGRYLVPLGGRDWSGPLPGQDELDALAAEHVRQFWERYGLEFPFKLEHKMANSFTRAAYWSKGDYALRTPKEDKFALRGKDRPKKDTAHPSYRLLVNILDGKDEFPADLSYTRGGILKIGKWRIVQQSGGPAYRGMKRLRPGDNLPTTRHEARYNNVHFPLKDERDYLSRRNRKKTHRGRPVQWFERHGRKGVSAVLRGMGLNTLR
jgi:hypothetical protein